MTSTAATPPFFQPHWSYTLADASPSAEPTLSPIFTVEHVARHPDTGELHAVGWVTSTLPGAPRGLVIVREDEYSYWTPYASDRTLTGHPATDHAHPLLAVCVFGWPSCTVDCDTRALTVYVIATDLETARHAGQEEAGNFSSTERRCPCPTAEPVLYDVLTVPVGAGEPQSRGAGENDSIVLCVNTLNRGPGKAT